MKYVAASHKGLVRDNNEDYYYCSSDINKPLFIVADGIGGEEHGELASKMAVSYVQENLKEKSQYHSKEELEQDFVKTISKVNKLIYEKSTERPEYEGMGTTLSFIYKWDDTFLIGNVGDSRVYAVNDDNIIQLTEDDTYVNKLLKIGQITKEEAKDHKMRNYLINAIGSYDDVEINIIDYQFNKDSYILICTDGLSDMVKDSKIKEIINSSDDLDIIKDELLNAALKNGGKDNITFIIIKMR